MWPDVSVLVVTYDRPEEIRRTINALRERIVYHGNLRWVVADDSSPGSYLADLQRDYPDIRFKFVITRRGGWGRNVNHALGELETEYYFMCEDDYVARRPIDLNCGVALLQSDDSLGLVRYDGLAGHRLTLDLRESDTQLGRLPYLKIRKDSLELNIYSNRPHLTRKRFHMFYGLYAEGRKLGETEEFFAHGIKDRSDGPELIALWDGIACAFDHIGKTRQGTEFDVQ